MKEIGLDKIRDDQFGHIDIQSRWFVQMRCESMNKRQTYGYERTECVFIVQHLCGCPFYSSAFAGDYLQIRPLFLFLSSGVSCSRCFSLVVVSCLSGISFRFRSHHL